MIIFSLRAFPVGLTAHAKCKAHSKYMTIKILQEEGSKSLFILLTFIPQDPFWPERQILLFHWNPCLPEKRNLSPSPVTSPLIYWTTNEASPGSEMVCRQQLSLWHLPLGISHWNSQLWLNVHRKKRKIIKIQNSWAVLSPAQYRCYYLMFVFSSFGKDDTIEMFWR